VPRGHQPWRSVAWRRREVSCVLHLGREVSSVLHLGRSFSSVLHLGRE
jgi:hypothetical protein